MPRVWSHFPGVEAERGERGHADVAGLGSWRLEGSWRGLVLKLWFPLDAISGGAGFPKVQECRNSRNHLDTSLLFLNGKVEEASGRHVISDLHEFNSSSVDRLLRWAHHCGLHEQARSGLPCQCMHMALNQGALSTKERRAEPNHIKAQLARCTLYSLTGRGRNRRACPSRERCIARSKK